ncbi:Guanosine pentaphosphate synthetase I/polyribonucleotide nucleotidyltransferase [Parasponia andersonii]|uniref:Ribosomal RNA-processing protein 42 n=1 Tax=Parasponia andersonii TaxID=3476 RepID=A0A2P5BB75_PARAD|nr:Guanosine pentaphosphate synthetase I/polyribonucleotide nucleotidyltransferase [Parasponia andersonii]
MIVWLSLGDKHFIQNGTAQDLRSDGRKRLTHRPIYVETRVIPQAELGRPSQLQPDKGKVSIHIDCSSTAEPVSEGRGGEELSTELSVALQRSLLGGKGGSVVVEGKICWVLYIDGLVVSSDGNSLDALVAAIRNVKTGEIFFIWKNGNSFLHHLAALSNTGSPRVQVASSASGDDDQPEVDISNEEFLQFDTSAVPVIVGKHYIADATAEEESQMSSAVSISVNRKGHICGLTKRGGAGLDPSIILDMKSVAKHASEQLMNKLDSEDSSCRGF